MLTFHVNPDLSGYNLLFEAKFYNTFKFIQHQQYDPILSFFILDEKAKDAVCMIHFTVVGEAAFSLPKSPFGGFEYHSSVDTDVLLDFIRYIEIELIKIGICKVKITVPPEIYSDSGTTNIIGVLTDSNYKVVVSDVNHFVGLDEIEGIKQLHPMERRNFRKTLAKNYKWKLESNDNLPEVYSFIERYREQQSLKVNILYSDLVRSFKAFPGKYRIMSIRHLGYLAAVTITVEVSKDILYNYLPASDKKFKQDSPMVFLLVNLYKYAKSLNYQILDLGLSSVNGKIQTGLAEFKERMGAHICDKKIMEKAL